MTSLQSPKAARTLGGVVASLGATVARNLAATQETLAARLTEEARQQAAREAQQAQKAREKEEGLARRRPLALKGVARLFAFIQSPEMQKLFELDRQVRGGSGTSSINFYSATRASGDAWDTYGHIGSGHRDVRIHLRPASILVAYGTDGISMEEILIVREDSEDTRLAKLYPIESAYFSQPLIALRPNQFFYEWHPPNIAYQVFVGCARKSCLDHLLDIALKGYEEHVGA